MNKYLVSLNNLNEIDEYKKVGVSTFLLPLKDFCVGYNTYYSIDEINSVFCDKYILINRVLDNNFLDEFKNICKRIDCKGFIIEDIGLINVLKDCDKEIILFMNHFNCNYESINTWLKYVDSVFVSNELTYDEIKEITDKVNKKVVLNVYGHNQVMYSRRYLLKNYYDNYKLEYQNHKVITDKMGSVSFIMHEDLYGTVCLSSKIFDGRKLLNLDAKYYYLNTSFIDLDTTLKFINNEEIINSDNGFLDKKTIFKLGDKNA